MKKQIISFSLVVTGFLLGATALSALAQTWSPPGTGYPAGTNCTPPNCNVPAPINVGVTGNTSSQVKNDGLIIKGLLGLGSLQFLPSSMIATVNGVDTGIVPSNSVLGNTDNSGTVGWVPAGFTNMQVFNSSGTFSIPSGVTKVMVEAWGGGAGGGFSSSCNGGGGGGGYGLITQSVTPGQTINVTVGSGGAAGTSSSNSGGAGGSTTFGSLTSNGGGSGVPYTSYSSSAELGGTSNAGSLSGIAISGGDGGFDVGCASGAYTAGSGGNGGNGGSGGRGASYLVSQGVGDGKTPGGGGGGGTLSGAAGAGASGRVIVWY